MRTRTLIYLIVITVQFNGIFASESFSQEKPPEVLNAISELQERIEEKIKVNWNKDNQRVESLDGKLSPPIPGSPSQAALQFLKENADIFQLPHDLHDLRFESTQDISEGNKIIHFQQTFGGLPVFDATSGYS